MCNMNISLSQSVLPPDLVHLPVITAQRWLQVGRGEEFPTMEGAVFGADNSLFCAHRTKPWTDILRISSDKNIEIFYHDDDAVIIGLAIHKDGRVFAADINGRLLVISPNGKLERDLFECDSSKTYRPNDLAFDMRGNIYFSDFIGTESNLTGGIYRLDAKEDYREIVPVAGDLCTPNGVAFSPDYSVLWTSESLRNNVIRIELGENGFKTAHFSSQMAVYHNQGYPHVDSCKTDAEGNVYMAIMQGGRALVLNSSGIPVANILLEDRDDMTCIMSTNLALKPGTDEAFILSSGKAGAWIYKFKALTLCAPLYSEVTI